MIAYDSSQYTKEPWSLNEWPQPDSSIAIGAIGTPLIARVILRDVSINEQKANARRIVAAVNACEGIPTDLLEGFSRGFLATVPDRALQDRKQRDSLIEAIWQTLDENGHLADGDNCTLIGLKLALESIGAAQVVRSQATDAALSRQVACTDGLGAVPPEPTFNERKEK